MAKPYDATSRTLLERHPEDWLPLVHLDRGLPVRVVDSNVSTVTAEADKVLRVGGPSPGVVHVEVQKDYDPSIPLRLLRYNALLRVSHKLPVLSAVVLLVPEADGPALTGVYADQWPDARSRVEFHYPVVRVWELPAAALAAAPGTLPLAALAARNGEEAVRLLAPALAAFHHPPTQDERDIAAACYVFAGLKFDKNLVERIFKGENAMKESVTYLAILEEGREEGRIAQTRRILLLVGSQKFGPPDEVSRARVDAVSDVGRLENLAGRVLTASDWDDLLAGLDLPSR